MNKAKLYRSKKRETMVFTFSVWVCLMLQLGCVEPFDAITQDFQRGVVIEATLTNETKRHEVFLSKVHSFEKDSVTTINDADVTIVDEQGNAYQFQEREDGRYVSDLEFAAQKGVGYSLVINAKGGRTYRSTIESFDEEAQIDNVFAERGPNSSGKDGVMIYADGSGPIGNAQYFRYDYEETYKIVAPNYINLDFKLENFDPCSPPETYSLEIVSREEQQRVCYGYQESDKIILASTIGQSGGSVKKHPIRFIPFDDYILANRYSILVRQYVQSADAYTYFDTLNEFSSSESVFTNVQPGFLQGNIKADGEEAEAVIGYFEVVSVSERRLFFNYTDFFPDSAPPDYPINCDANFFRPPTIERAQFCDSSSFPHCDQTSLWALIDQGAIAYWQDTGTNSGCGGGPYEVVPRGCGDCTVFGSNEVPDFWTE